MLPWSISWRWSISPEMLIKNYSWWLVNRFEWWNNEPSPHGMKWNNCLIMLKAYQNQNHLLTCKIDLKIDLKMACKKKFPTFNVSATKCVRCYLMDVFIWSSRRNQEFIASWNWRSKLWMISCCLWWFTILAFVVQYIITQHKFKVQR